MFPLCDEYGFCVDVLGRQVPCVCVDVLGRQVPCVCVDVLGSPVRCACVDVLRCTAPSACADAFVTVDIALNKLPVIPATIEVPSAHQMVNTYLNVNQQKLYHEKMRIYTIFYFRR